MSSFPSKSKRKKQIPEIKVDWTKVSDCESKVTITQAPRPRPHLDQSALRPQLSDAITQARARGKPVVHVLGIPHTITSEEWSHCAFTGKVLRFPDVLRAAGYCTIEYSNGVSESTADAQITMLSRDELAEQLGATDGLTVDESRLHDLSRAVEGQLARVEFSARVKSALRRTVEPGDLICHAWDDQLGRELIAQFPDAIHVESGIGYPNAPFGAYRIFESHSWRSWHAGRHHSGGAEFPHYGAFACSYVAHNYYDHERLPFTCAPLGECGCMQLHCKGGRGCEERQQYVLFVGRMTSAKGIEVINEIALAHPDLTVKIVTAEPQSDRLSAKNIDFIGRVDSRAQIASLYERTLCTIVPSRYWEPFGGVHSEALLCGCPVVASDFGCFPEFIGPADGYLASTPEEFVWAVDQLKSHAQHSGPESQGSLLCDRAREQRRQRAIARYGIEAVARQYKGAFAAIRRAHAQGIRPI